MKTPYDVIVCGGGPSGIAAAVTAAENGAKTLLVEANGELGGTATSGGVAHFLGGRTADCSKFVGSPFFRRLVDVAVKRGIALLPQPENEGYSPYGWDGNPHLTAGVPFDRFQMAVLFDEMVQQSGADVLLCTHVIGCEREGDTLQKVELFNGSGKTFERAKFFIDATGDADLAALAGVPFKVGVEKNGACAPATLEFEVEHVDDQALKAYIDTRKAPRFLSEIKLLKEQGLWPFAFDRLITVRMPERDCFMVNTPRLTGVNALDGRSVSEALIEGRRMILELFNIMKMHFPGFANARIRSVAPMLGIRESRRIDGDFVLTVADVVHGRKFDDTVGYCCYGWDLPDPDRPSYQPMTEKEIPIHGDLIPIPFRIMVPRGVRNLLVTGRTVSVERDVLGPLRVMASCMAMGEAAGRHAAEISKVFHL